MPTQATITLTDGEASPVAHPFTVDGVLPNGVRRWRELSASNPAATKYLTIHNPPSPSKPSDYQIPGRDVVMRKVNIKLTWPITYVDAVSGLTLVDHVLQGNVQLLASPRALGQQVKNLRFSLGTLLNAVSIGAAFDTGEQFSG